jgi:hypothetical protein
MFRTLLREFSDLAEQLLIALAGELRAAREAARTNGIHVPAEPEATRAQATS